VSRLVLGFNVLSAVELGYSSLPSDRYMLGLPVQK
jgi:hypothetical protein